MSSFITAAVLTGVGLTLTVAINPIANWMGSNLPALLGGTDTSSNVAAIYESEVLELMESFDMGYSEVQMIQAKLLQATTYFREDDGNVYKTRMEAQDRQVDNKTGNTFSMRFVNAQNMFMRALENAVLIQEEIERLYKQFFEIKGNITNVPAPNQDYPLAEMMRKAYDPAYLAKTFGDGVAVSDPRVTALRKDTTRNLVQAINELQSLLETLRSNTEDLRRIMMRVAVAVQVVYPDWKPNLIYVDNNGGSPAGLMTAFKGLAESLGDRYKGITRPFGAPAEPSAGEISNDAQKAMQDITAQYLYAQGVMKALGKLAPAENKQLHALVMNDKGRYAVIELTNKVSYNKDTQIVTMEDKSKWEVVEAQGLVNPSSNKQDLVKKKDSLTGTGKPGGPKV